MEFSKKFPADTAVIIYRRDTHKFRIIAKLQRHDANTRGPWLTQSRPTGC